MFNNSTDIFINTLASLQKLDDLDRLINPNSAFFQSYRNSLNEVQLDYIEAGSINDFARLETTQDSKEGIQASRQPRNIPSLECLPSLSDNPKPEKPSPLREKENDTKKTKSKLEHVSSEKPVLGFNSLTGRPDGNLEKLDDMKSKFSFQKIENINSSSETALLAKKDTGSRCTCTNSRCLKLYCACFSSGEMCGPHCQCKSCFNNDANDEIRKAMVEETLQKNPNAFQSKYKRHVEKGAMLHVRGCNCSKTGCVKEYCECFKIGTGCSRLCRCVNCQNKKIDLQKDEVTTYHVKAIRKRRKTRIYEEKFGDSRKKASTKSNSGTETLF